MEMGHSPAVLANALAVLGCGDVPSPLLQHLAQRLLEGETLCLASYGRVDDVEPVLTVATPLRLLQVFALEIPSISPRQLTAGGWPITCPPGTIVVAEVGWRNVLTEAVSSPVFRELVSNAFAPERLIERLRRFLVGPLPRLGPFLQVVDTAVAWCRTRSDPQNPAVCLRSGALRPPEAWFAHHHPSDVDAVACEVVAGLAQKRSLLVEGGLTLPASFVPQLAGGRLLASGSLFSGLDGIPAIVTDGYFDHALSLPPWDTWVAYVEEADLSTGAWHSREQADQPWEACPRDTLSYLVSWVPAEFVEGVQTATEISSGLGPTQVWLENLRTPLTQCLYQIGLLASA